MNRHMGINELTSRDQESYTAIGARLEDRQVLSREYKALRREKMREESAWERLLLKREKQRTTQAAKIRSERATRHRLTRQIRKLSDAHGDANHHRELKQCRRALERLVAKHKANRIERRSRKQQINQLIDAQARAVETAGKRMAESVREESRLQALIDEQYVRLDTRRKAFMDAIRISSRNIFCKLAMEFRPLYNNYRDDHFIVRELTRSSGIIHKRDGMAHVLLMPTMQFQPATRDIVQIFLARMSQRINDHFEGRSMPIHIQLLDENSNHLDIDQHGLRWVSAPS
jgi:hypothetical protein